VGREISKAEVLQLISKAKKAGLVLQPENTQHPHFVCCCCGCCCGVLSAAKLFAKPAEYLHSNYFALVEAEKCGLCEVCLKRCPMDAFRRTNNHMEVSLDRCIGCGACIASCPYDARYPHPDGYVDKCTFCAHRIKNGQKPARPVARPFTSWGQEGAP
jgi:Fe-S-cluster-containing dehydrogenase component